MVQKFKILFVLFTLLSSNYLLAQNADSQTKEEDKKESSRPLLSASTNFDIGYNFGNLSPMSNKYTEDFKTLSGTFAFNFLIRGIGLDYSYTNTSRKIEDLGVNSSVSYNYIGLASSITRTLENKNLSYSSLTSIGYVNYSNNIDKWGLEKSQSNVSAHGFGIHTKTSLGFNILRYKVGGSDRVVNMSLNFGARLFTTFDWKGSEQYISSNTYNAKLFGKDANVVLIPYIGISFLSF